MEEREAVTQALRLLEWRHSWVVVMVSDECARSTELVLWLKSDA